MSPTPPSHHGLFFMRLHLSPFSPQVFSEFDAIVTNAYDELDNQAGISKNMDPLLEFAENMPFMSSALSNAKTNASVFQSQADSLNSSLEEVASNVTSILTTGCGSPECSDMLTRMSNLAVVVNYTGIENSFTRFIAALDNATRGDLSGELNTGYDSFKSVVQQVNNSVFQEIESSRRAAEQVGDDIEKELNNIENDLEDIDFSGVSEDMESLSDDVKEPVNYAFYGMSGLSGLVLLIVLFTYLGIMFGCFCPHNKSPRGCCTMKAGATFLLVGVGLTFIFFALLMLLLIVLMLSGGLMHTELCRHLVNLDQSPVADIVDDLLYDTLYEDTGISLSISNIYTNCKNNEAFYTALDVGNTFGFDLDTLLDTSAIDDEIEKLRNTQITLTGVRVLTTGAIFALNGLAAEIETAQTETANAIIELEKDVANEDLGALADDLQKLVPSAPALAQYVLILDNLNDDVSDLDTEKAITRRELSGVDAMLRINVTGITLELQTGEQFINTNGSAIVENVVDNSADTVETIVSEGVGAINDSVRNQIGQCAPVYNAYSTIIDAGCVEVLYPLNGYWFALGWSLFFLIVDVIMSFKLTTLYRRPGHNRIAVAPSTESRIRHDKVRTKR